ncbi:hypothetical protein D3C71_1654260 [compost metagenome]
MESDGTAAKASLSRRVKSLSRRACCQALRLAASIAGWNFSSSARKREALKRNMPLFQKYSPDCTYALAVSASGFSTNRSTARTSPLEAALM